MKNKVLLRLISISLASFLAISNYSFICLAEGMFSSDTYIDENLFEDHIEVTPTIIPENIPVISPVPTITPSPMVTVMPEENPELTVTPSPEAVVTPFPEVTVTPSPEATITLTPELTVTPEPTITETPFSSEEENTELFDDKKDEVLTDDSNINDSLNAITGTPVYVTNMVSNLHAGNEFYLNSLKNSYQITFSDDFGSCMKQIESEYKKKNKIQDVCDLENRTVTNSSDTLLVRNWQDIIAIYIYEQHKKGVESYTLDMSCKEELSRIFEEMNPIVSDKKDISKFSYANLKINSYIVKNKLAEEDRKFLEKYVETDCKLLCAVVTAENGFVRQSVGDQVCEERVNVIAAAYSLVGKIGYFWGGKSTALGMDPRWGKVTKVTTEGSRSTGSVRGYGLDCSGFVTWAVINGYQKKDMESVVGVGTSSQWYHAGIVSEKNAKPGDLVFQRGPEAESDNHVGILCGQTDAGDWIVVHCSSGKNGVTVGEAYSAGFRYIRQPQFYPTESEIEKMKEKHAVFGSLESEDELNEQTDQSNNMETSVSITSASSLDEIFGGIETNEALFNDEENVILTDDSQVMPF